MLNKINLRKILVIMAQSDVLCSKNNVDKTTQSNGFFIDHRTNNYLDCKTKSESIVTDVYVSLVPYIPLNV